MKKTLLLACLFAGIASQAQFWTPKATGFATASRGIDQISIVNDNVIWAKAYDGSGAGSQTIKEFTKSTDGGNTWTATTIALGLGTSGLGISSLTAISTDTAWLSAYPATGGVQGIWRTDNGGTTWTKQTTAAFSGAASFANFVYFFDANNGVAQGDPEGGYFEIYTTSNGGTTWTRLPSANIPAPISATEYGYVHNFDAVGSTIWFGTNFGRLFRSSDMGMNWTVAQSPVSDFAGAGASGNYTFSDVNKGLLNSSAGQLWSTNDGGTTWTPVVTTDVFGNNDLEYIPGTSKVISTGGATGYGSYFSLDDGLTWEPAEENTQFTVLEFLNPTTGFAGGFNTNSTTGGIFKYTGTQLPVATFMQDQFVAFPNPTRGTINLSGAPFTAVNIVDLLGKTVLTKKFASVENTDIDLSALNSGVYLMTVLGETASQTIRVVKN